MGNRKAAEIYLTDAELALLRRIDKAQAAMPNGIRLQSTLTRARLARLGLVKSHKPIYSRFTGGGFFWRITILGEKLLDHLKDPTKPAPMSEDGRPFVTEGIIHARQNADTPAA
jgi:hypothetical protein